VQRAAPSPPAAPSPAHPLAPVPAPPPPPREKDALNLLFLLIPLINVALPFAIKSFPVIFSADVAALAGVYAAKGVWSEVRAAGGEGVARRGARGCTGRGGGEAPAGAAARRGAARACLSRFAVQRTRAR
jgi:hypothetical protein